MTKRIILSTVVAAALATSALADNTFGGVTGSVLGGTGLNNYHTDDFFNIYANPANLLDHKDSAIIEMDLANNARVAGTVIDLGSSGTLGLMVGRTDTSGIDTFAGAFTPIRMSDILYATDLGGMKLGARFSIGMNSAPVTNATYTAYTDASNYTLLTTTDNESITDMSLDIGLKINKNLSAGVAIDMANGETNLGAGSTVQEGNVAGVITTTNAINKTVGDGGMSILANVQYGMKLGKTDTLITAYYKSSNLNNTNTTDNNVIGTTTTGTITNIANVNTTTTMAVDGAFKLLNTADTKVTLVTGLTMVLLTTGATNSSVIKAADVISFDGVSASNVTNGTMMMIPLTLAVEQKVNENWTWRAGASGNIYGGYGQETVTSVYKSDGATGSVVDYTNTTTVRQDIGLAATVATGVTYNVAKGINVVGTIGTNFLLGGPNFLSGAANGNMFGQGAITYNF